MWDNDFMSHSINSIFIRSSRHRRRLRFATSCYRYNLNHPLLHCFCHAGHLIQSCYIESCLAAQKRFLLFKGPGFFKKISKNGGNLEFFKAVKGQVYYLEWPICPLSRYRESDVEPLMSTFCDLPDK